MATSSKIPVQHAVRGVEVSLGSATAERPLRLFVWPAATALVGLACAVQSALLLRHVMGVELSQGGLIVCILAALFVNSCALAAIVALSTNDLLSRLLLAFAFNFLTHFVWLSFAVGLSGEVAWSFIPATYLAALACSLAVDTWGHASQSQRVGAIALGLPSDVVRRLDERVELVCDSFADPSQYDVLLVDLAGSLPAEWRRFASRAALAGCDIRDARSYIVQRKACLLPEDIDPETIRRNLARRGAYAPLKRWIDIGATLLISPMAIILVGMASLAILITMGRPIFFTQDRVGRNGRIFRMYKLRTMSPQTPGGRQIATSKSDMRVTPLGRILRRYRVDELPQLFNILKGDMSLIGPRPEQPQLVKEYSQVVTHYDLRHEVQPGLSGWAQVNSGYASTVEETREKLTYDLFYVREFGLALDVEIAIATLWTLMTGRNAR